jgi:protein TonB
MSRNAYLSNNDTISRVKVFGMSVLCTVLIFLFLPALEQFMRSISSILDVRPVEVQRAIVRPIPPPPPEPEKKVKKIRLKTVKPKMRTKTRKTEAPSKIKASLSLDMMNQAIGDFSLNFDVEPSMDDSELIFQLEEVEKAPAIKKRVNPVYPFKAKDRGIEGKVVVYFVVDATGMVRENTIEITEAKPGAIFNEAAKNAVKQWQFYPGEMNGSPVAVLMTVTLVFDLN